MPDSIPAELAAGCAAPAAGADRAAPCVERRASSAVEGARAAAAVEAARERDAATYTIGMLAHEFGLTTRAIRFYEDCGLLQPQRSGRQRIYTARDRTRLKLTLRGKRLGLKLSQVKELVDMYESPRDTEPQLREFLRVLALHQAQLQQQMSDLGATLDEVRAHQREACRLLAAGERRKRA